MCFLNFACCNTLDIFWQKLPCCKWLLLEFYNLHMLKAVLPQKKNSPPPPTRKKLQRRRWQVMHSKKGSKVKCHGPPIRSSHFICTLYHSKILFFAGWRVCKEYPAARSGRDCEIFVWHHTANFSNWVKPSKVLEGQETRTSILRWTIAASSKQR